MKFVHHPSLKNHLSKDLLEILEIKKKITKWMRLVAEIRRMAAYGRGDQFAG
jgi:hypothetical protein